MQNVHVSLSDISNIRSVFNLLLKLSVLFKKILFQALINCALDQELTNIIFFLCCFKLFVNYFKQLISQNTIIAQIEGGKTYRNK